MDQPRAANESALRDLEVARKRLGMSGKGGGQVEGIYAQAYARLVKLGVYPQLRLKYRPQ